MPPGSLRSLSLTLISTIAANPLAKKSHIIDYSEETTAPPNSINQKALGEPDIIIPDVPKCYNYGVYFDDDYDYTKHMKSMKEFMEDPQFDVVEGGTLPPSYVPQEVEPVIAEPLDPDFEMPSDDELIAEEGELEENFVELAGGKHVKMDDDEEEACLPPQPSTSNLPMHKVRMMERFLWGSELPSGADPESYGEGGQSSTAPAPSTAIASARKGRPLTGQEDFLEKQFDKLMKKTKSRSGIDGMSIVSGTSVMSESLQSVVAADQLMIAKKIPQNDDYVCLDAVSKANTLKCVEEMEEPGDDPLALWVGPSKSNLGSIIQSNPLPAEPGAVKQPSLLAIPKLKSTGVRPASRGKPAKSDSDSGADDDSDGSGDGASRPVSHRCRIRGETAEEKRARKKAIKAHKKERQSVKKLNKTTFRNELKQAKANGHIRVSHIE